MSGVASSDHPRVDLHQLVDQFYGQVGSSQLGDFEPVDQVPPPYDGLLDHNEHMTVTVESFHRQPVNVNVHRCQRNENWYAREITLETRQSKRIVQYGIVRLDIDALDPIVWQKIESQQIPLGRVLIEHNVMRLVQLCQLWKIHAGPALAALMHVATGDVLYGRTALIYCDQKPAIELLEIVAPVTSEAKA